MIGCRTTELVTVLKLDIHNDQCADRILQLTKRFPGVEEVKIDRGANRLTVEGILNPWKLQERIQKKTKHKVEVLCSAKEKKGATQVSTLILKVALHCDGCTRRIRRAILKIEGVEEVTIDTEKNHITVKGTMKTEGFPEYASRKIGKNVEVVVPETSEKMSACHADGCCCYCNQSSYPFCKLPALQLLSDENPNACALM